LKKGEVLEGCTVFINYVNSIATDSSHILTDA